MKNDSKKAAYEICRILFEKKAEDILIIDIKDKTIIADYFIVCTGRSNTLVKTLCDEVEDKMEALHGMPPRRLEGYAEGRWVVMDYSDILVHIFHPEERKYYNIERLWEDAGNTVEYNGQLTGEE